MKKEAKRAKVFNRDGSKAPTVADLTKTIEVLTGANHQAQIDSNGAVIELTKAQINVVRLEAQIAKERVQYGANLAEYKRLLEIDKTNVKKVITEKNTKLKIAEMTIKHLRAAVIDITKDQMDTTQLLSEARVLAEEFAGEKVCETGCACGH